MRYCIVGAGFSGAVIGRALAEAGHKVLVIDERLHVAGNCHSQRDPQTGVMTHVYGPHIFHTGDERVWAYVQRFGSMRPYRHRVQAVAGGMVYSLPVNLLTINQFFRKVMGPEEARAFVASKTRPISNPANFEEQALSMIGAELYEAFFRGYTRKQWGLDPAQLPASILKRLPLRFDYDDSYFAHPHQAIPERGYTELVAAILDTPNLELRLGARFEDLTEAFAHVVYSGPIDRYFRYDLGRLGYRTLDFETIRAKGDYQGTAVVNYCDEATPYTRVTEHKHFAPWEKDQVRRHDTLPRIQPILRPRRHSLLSDPTDRRRGDAEEIRRSGDGVAGVTFVGRLGSYRYLDMDVTIGEALSAADAMVERIAKAADIPVFFVPPLQHA